MAIKIPIKPNSPGYALAVVKNGQVVYQEFMGLANLNNQDLINQGTAFRLASLSKQFTAMAIIILKDRRLLNYDDRLTRFFPDFPEYGCQVTIRQLLTHTSGMPDHEQSLYRELKKNPRVVPNIYDSLRVLKQQKQLLFPAGSKFQYSDSGFVVLALIIEKVSSMSFRQFLKRNIFQPLNMTNSDVLDDTKPEINNRAYGYRTLKKGFKLFDFDPLNYVVGDEGVYASLDDMVKWSNAWEKPMGGVSFSWLIKNYQGEKIIYQDGWWVGFRNIILKVPKKNTIVIILSNRTDLETTQQRIAAAISYVKILSR